MIILDKYKLAEKDIRTIEEIVARDHTAEVKPTKDGIIILEVRKTIKHGCLAESGQ